MRRGLRVREVVSFGVGFVWALGPWIAYAAAGPKRHGPQYLSDDGTVSRGIFYGEVYSHITLKISRAATLAE